jgi:hypothetical protein
MVRLFAMLSALAMLSSCADPDYATVGPFGFDPVGSSAPSLAFDFRTSTEGQARCRFVIDPNNVRDHTAAPQPEARWRAYVDGLCSYYYAPPIGDYPLDGGTLVLTEMRAGPDNGAAVEIANPYFVYLNFRDRHFMGADGSWNGVRESTHAHTPLGSVPDYPMRRDGACWVSTRARICLER